MRHWLIVLLTGLATSALAGEVDEKRPYGRACFVVISGDGAEAKPLSRAELTRGGELAVHLEANTSCQAVVAVLGKRDAKLVNGWRPKLVTLDEWDPKCLPAGAEKWTLDARTEPFTAYVVFLPNDASSGRALRELVRILADPNTSTAVQNTAARQLRGELEKWQANPDAIARAPQSAPTAVGGSLRSAADFPWRSFAFRANFTADKPAVIAFDNAVGR